MKTVVILGAGNVAFHLTRAFLDNTIDVKQIYSRNLVSAKEIADAHKIRYTDQISEIEKADLYVICALDRAITEISYHIPFSDALVVHTSGSMPMESLKGNYRKGVLYPLQSFSKNRILEYDEIPFFIQTENENDDIKLKKLLKKVSNKVYSITAKQRMKMHISAVWVNNFTNYFYTLGAQICEKENIPFDILKPLIQETTAKIMDMKPIDAQTGPAKRNDQIVIEKHLEVIEDSFQKQIYQLISQSITNLYHDKL